MPNTLDHCMVPLTPVFDVRGDLTRLRGIMGALAYLTGPAHLKEDDELEILNELLCDVHERIDAACEQLGQAIQGMKEIVSVNEKNI